MQNGGQNDGLAGRAEHVDRRSVVAEKQRATLFRAPPKALLTEREVPAPNPCRDVSIKQSESVGRCDWDRWLHRIIIRRCNHLSYRKRICWSAWRVLVLAAHVHREAPCRRVRRKSVVRIQPLLVWPTVVINNRLAEVIAVIQRQSANVCHAGVYRFDMRRRCF